MIVVEFVFNVDDILGEMFLEEKELINDDIKVIIKLILRIVVSCCFIKCILVVVYYFLILYIKKKLNLMF